MRQAVATDTVTRTRTCSLSTPASGEGLALRPEFRGAIGLRPIPT